MHAMASSWSSTRCPNSSMAVVDLYSSPFFFCRTVLPPLCFSSVALSLRPRPPPPSSSLLFCQSSKKNDSGFIDRILDYIEGGPKLRKWYGASELLPNGVKDVEDDEAPETDEIRDAVLVTNGESEIGQMVILSLILKRTRVKALVKDKKASVDAFGTYLESLAGDLSDRFFLSKALRGVRSIISPANVGYFHDAGRMKGVQHVVLLSQLDVYRSSGGFQAIMNNKVQKLAERDEEVITSSGIPYTIVRAGLLQDTPGGRDGFCFDELFHTWS
ncbi:Uncharacterized protein AXF42_Ash006820 [Apostasia shenzhenica]|uniref:NAD(P)-binding domain-containing protein n=1 Tax=Apostasia shenzhenica TaxID=1088818 RepID=A0A2I0AJA0_9ASPA|nr:Uncharacterized protein AXF42_Ash006820 [Apostasia shenzhenica]